MESLGAAKAKNGVNFSSKFGVSTYGCKTPVLDDLHMVDTFVVFKPIQAAGVSAHICRNSKTLQCAYMHKTVIVQRRFSAYIHRNSKISKLNQNENNSVCI